MLSSPWTLLLAALPALVSAGVEFTSPQAGATIKGGEAITIEWKNGGDGPALADLTTYELSLWAGGNTDGQMAQVLGVTTTPVAFSASGNKASIVVPIGTGGSTKNAYFFRIHSVARTGGVLIQFSPRFTLSGMTGVFADIITTGMSGVTGTDGPPTIDNTAKAPINPADGDFGVAYTMQTGATRYAPMQPVPPTKITQKKYTPAYPTSAIPSIATTFLPIPKQKTTVTKVQTFSVSSRENTAAAASHPTDNMAKFLARWRD
ncbi:cell wall synthesis protein KRE9/KNH1-domain-containing protein [Dendryphion nanum]|uniref:Cell wall synthesis protein KRE9/KNH1-domain-containing protein n=1 Tax=Dendryphion nanum TaxID=256645 RepID=A0A9P9IHG7_9PLEO|nr:cell wall synthesis protein KRE9/KNH1-domain-containing protein [Dendryphion nanum]